MSGSTPVRRRMSLGLSLATALTAVGAFTATATGTAVAAPAPPAGSPISLQSPACPATIQQGESDGCVTQLQMELNLTGAQIGADGQFGPATYTAVVNFQSAHGLTADGLVGPATKNALDSAALSASGTVNLSTSCANLSQGSTGACVSTLQQQLNGFGAGLTVDGRFGPGTDTAVRNFQSSHGLVSDGIVGPATKAALAGGTGGGSDLNLLSDCGQLQQGSQGSCVSTLQIVLNGYGAGLTVDGQFGAGTDTAVRNFQSSHGLTADGIVGTGTKNALYGLSSSGGGTSTTVDLRTQCGTLQSGASGSCVSTLQTMLNNLGAGLTVDGQFGPGTDTAVRNFQSSRGLAVDGIVGPATKNALYGGGSGPISTGTPPSGGPIDDTKVLTAAKSFLGLPYVWGGGHSLRGEGPGPSLGTCADYTGSILPCPANTTVGLDCSGLVRAAYWFGAGIDLGNGGNTNDQTWDRRTLPISASQRQPGDIEFFGDGPHSTHHVIIYAGTDPTTGADMMYEAQETGTNVHYVSLRTGGYWYHVVA
ncbi:peptidoglycan-binding protein [Kitasatospora aureofaciens]|uniref:C40 family peptidase n=1 Tax=Kitasatospora aureofaciens TaxID=1894 RepID=UPI001C43A07E|nr:peptidoglycan-binding protein [Kitasatospora aureofaciens]MBV6702247.1 peptidoglycan-binding protein [Kitasatospora aureofaciens]